MICVCSNCGIPCGIDSRMGSVDHYLVCHCSSPENTHWINDGRGGYTEHLNGATPITIHEYLRKKSRDPSHERYRSQSERWDREDD